MKKLFFLLIAMALSSVVLNGQENKKVEIFEGRGAFDSKVILDLSNRNLNTVPVNADNMEIEILLLDNNNIEKLPMWLGNLKNLKVLSIRNNNLKSTKSISFCENLEQIYLNGNKELSDLTGLSSCKKVKLIDVTETQIHDVPGWARMMDNLHYFKYSK